MKLVILVKLVKLIKLLIHDLGVKLVKLTFFTPEREFSFTRIISFTRIMDIGKT